MQAVLKIVKHVFWSDSFSNPKLLPSENSLGECNVTLTDLATMTGKERVAVFRQCGIDSSLFPLFLRALQHMTAIHGSGCIDANCIVHWYLSARHWSPFTYSAPLLGYPSVVSPPLCTNEHDGLTRDTEPSVQIASLSVKDHHYNGLLNQGATCYLNSLLQALFHISAFRSIIYQMPKKEEVPEGSCADESATKSIPYALQRLFCMLQTSSTAVGTTELTDSFGWSASDSFIQHDVHELTRVLLDNLEEKINAQTLDDDRKENAIFKLFNGSLESYIRVDEAGYYGARAEPFYDLQLVIKDTRDIYASFDVLFQVEVLDGKNKYCLEQNGKKTYHRAEKGVRLKETPPIMLLHLARFDYDIQHGEMKILTRWDYYGTLDLSRYMPHVPPEDTHYTLYSVLVHSGSNTGFGHYFCFVLSAGMWYKFNDESVTRASLCEVFGANFGGCTTNYWGSDVALTTNAYMLIYIRTSQMKDLLRPIQPSDLPRHVMEQLRKEQVDHEQRIKEQAENHLFGLIYFLQPSELADHGELLTSRRPLSRKFSPQRILRVRLESEALPEFSSFAAREFGLGAEDPILWFAELCSGVSHPKLHKQVKPGMTVGDVLGKDRECCVLVTHPSTTPFLSLDVGEERSYELFHHKFYDPMPLKVRTLGCTVVKRDPSRDPQEVIAKMEPFIHEWIRSLPNESRTPSRRPPAPSQGKISEGSSMAKSADSNSECSHFLDHEEGKKCAPHQALPSGRLLVVCEGEQGTYAQCLSLHSGDIFVWQLETSLENRENVLYSDVQSFQHFLSRRIPVEIKLNQPPSCPTLIDTELADDMTYEQLQRYVSFTLGNVSNYDHIRFARHNPETELPFFAKGKKKDRPTLAQLLTPTGNRPVALSKQLYYEYCKFTVTEIESSHSLQFKLYSNSVKPLSSHWILISRARPVTTTELLVACIEEVRREYTSETATSLVAVGPEGKLVPGDSGEGSKISRGDPFVAYLMDADPYEAWRQVRLVDVWRGRIYSVVDRNHPLFFARQTFEESAEFRLEQIPQPIACVPSETQSLVQVYHFTTNRQRKDLVETHSEPFSLYVDHREQAGSLLCRVAEKLSISFASVQDWKVCLVVENKVLEVDPEIPMGTQMRNFCPVERYLLNQKEPAKAAFIGLEHASALARHAKREGNVVILN